MKSPTSLFQALIQQIKNKEAHHHAYGIQGDVTHVEILQTALDGAEVHVVIEDSFGIDEGRKLQEMALLRPQGSGDRKYILVHGRTFTREAQNALLKLFEEPTLSTHFFLILPSFDTFLPTLKSRLNIIHQNQAEQQEGLKAEIARVKEFLACGPGERLMLVKGLLEDLDKEKITRSDIERFLRALEHVVHREFATKKVMSLSVFEKFLTIVSYASDRSSSLKMILESVALILPILPTV